MLAARIEPNPFGPAMDDKIAFCSIVFGQFGKNVLVNIADPFGSPTDAGFASPGYFRLSANGSAQGPVCSSQADESVKKLASVSAYSRGSRAKMFTSC
jgi:hypothetical protein